MEAGVEAEETIVMTPKSRSAQSTCLIVERRRAQPIKSDDGGRVHVAGGHHTGIIINKDLQSE